MRIMRLMGCMVQPPTGVMLLLKVKIKDASFQPTAHALVRLQQHLESTTGTANDPPHLTDAEIFPYSVNKEQP
jgi:hypothetical protein